MSIIGTVLKYKTTLTCSLFILAGCAFCGDDDAKPTVKITTLTLASGELVKCVKMITATLNDQVVYTGVTLEGKRAEYTGDEVKSTSTQEVEIASLSEAAQKTVAKYSPSKKPAVAVAPKVRSSAVLKPTTSTASTPPKLVLLLVKTVVAGGAPL